MDGQSILLARLRDRLREAGVEVAADWTPAQGLPAAVDEDGLAAVVVLGHFDLATFAAGALAFAQGLPLEVAGRWYRRFTRTVFLVGNPAHLARRWRFAHASADGGMAWLAPADPGETLGLRRLLRLFQAALCPTHEVELTVPGAPAGQPSERRLTLACRGLTLGDYLVHAHHALCEATIAGAIRAGDRLRLVNVDELDPSRVREGYSRVHVDPGDPGRLRLFASLAGGSP